MYSTQHTYDQLWPLLQTGLSPALGNSRVLGRLQFAMGQLPIVSGGGFEVRLGSGEAKAIDLALHTTAAAGGMRLLASAQVTRDAPPSDAASSVWQRLRAFATQHQAPGELLREAVTGTWLEFDLDEDQLLPAPNVFLRLEDEFGAPPILGPLALARQLASHRQMQRAVQHLGTEPPTAALESLALCLRHRPGAASLKFLGLMLARPVRGFRLALSDVPLTELTAYLRSIGWPGDHRALVPLLYFVRQHADNVALQLDIADDGVQARLGLELSFNQVKDPTAPWTGLLDALSGLALCDPAKAKAVQAWPAMLRKVDAPELWPVGFSARQSWLRRSINHVKLSYEPTQDMPVHEGEFGPSPLAYLIVNRIVTAKAYLAFNHPEA